MDLWLPILRHALQAIAGFLAAKGIIDGSMEEAIVGFGVSAATIAWFWWERRKRSALQPDEVKP